MEPDERLSRALFIISKSFKTFDDLEELDKIFSDLRSLQIAMHSLNQTNRMTLLRNFSVKKLDAGKRLFKKGDPSACIYVILKGALQMFNHESPDCSDMTLVNYQTKGALIGERGILKNFPRSLTAIAAEETYLLVLEAKMFKLFLGKEVHAEIETKKKIIDQFIIGISQYPPSQKERLAYLIDFDMYRRGDIMIKQGTVTDNMMIITEGSCKLFQQLGPYKKTVSQLEKGSIIGDETALFDRPASFAAVAMSEIVKVAKIRNDDIKGLYPPSVVQSLRDSYNIRNSARHKITDFSHPCLKLKLDVQNPEDDFPLASLTAREKINRIRLRTPSIKSPTFTNENVRSVFKYKLQELREIPQLKLSRLIVRDKARSNTSRF